MGSVTRFGRLWGYLLFFVFVMVLFRQVILPFLFASLVAYMLAPAVQRLQPRLGRAGAVIALYVLLIGVFGGFLGVLLPAVAKEASGLRKSSPVLIERLNREWLPAASAWLDESFGSVLNTPGKDDEEEQPSEMVVTPMPDGSFRIALDDVRLRVHETGDGEFVIEPPGNHDEDRLGSRLRRLVASKGSELTAMLGSLVQAAVAGIFSFLTGFVVTFMLAAFMLVDLTRVRTFFRSLVPHGYRDEFDVLLEGIDRGMSGVIRGQLLICLVNGIFTYIGLLIFSVKYSVLLALLAAVFSLIPIFGTIISSIPIVLLALVSDDSGGMAFGKALGMLLWIGGIHLVEANLLNPKIMGDQAHIHPVVVVFALLAGESVYGLAGALLAVPVASMVQTVFLYAKERAERRRADEEVPLTSALAEDPRELPDDVSGPLEPEDSLAEGDTPDGE